jgi:heptosyltransferase-1
MKRVLLVKITSMGDLIQVFPAITDAVRANPGIQFDWVADTSFQDIPRLHPAVVNVIPISTRRWKGNMLQAVKSGEIRQFVKRLRQEPYDMVIDAQSNLKSAVVTALAKGRKYGGDKTSVREYGAQFAYHETATISRQQNHGDRMRQMMAAFLGYEVPTTVADYGIIQDNLPTLDFKLPQQFIVATPISSRPERLWPEPFWQAVMENIVQAGFDIILPWHSQEEKTRLTRLKGDNEHIQLLPPLNLAQKARVLSHARASISLDTGLAHMAAALEIPNVCLYGPTSAILTGTLGKHQIHLSASGPACAPCLKMGCHYQGESQYKPACLETITPEQVLAAFYQLV